jgi:hypothetical protein
MSSDLQKELNKRVMSVTFTKMNGDVRTMECTTNLELIPKNEHPTKDYSGVEEAYDPNEVKTTLCVFDVNAQGWRSFRVSNIIEAK